MSTDEIEKIREELAQAERDKKCKIALNPTISISKVQDIEMKYGVKFPKEYVEFITLIGDGGVLPPYTPEGAQLIPLSDYEVLGYSFSRIAEPYMLEKSWMPD